MCDGPIVKGQNDIYLGTVHARVSRCGGSGIAIDNRIPVVDDTLAGKILYENAAEL